MNTIDRLGGKELVGYHRKEGLEIGANQYLELYQKMLARGVSQTPKLYLDTKFWVLLRDAERKTNDEGTKLLELLRQLVFNRRLICVIQAASFLEIVKQSKKSLLVISNIINELTDSISIASDKELQKLEATNYVRSKLNAPPISQHYAWTKVGLVLHSNAIGHINNFLPETLNRASANVLLKFTIDFLWQAQLADILQVFNWDTAEKLSASIDQPTIEAIENRKVARDEENHSLQAIRKHEFETVIPSEYETIFGQTTFRIAKEAGKQIAFKDIQDDTDRLLDEAVREAVSGELNDLMPNTVIKTHLYCLYEHDAKKKLTSNDWFDMCHAAVALPYCDIFLTEKHLRHQICNVLEFDQFYDCEVLASVDEAIERLEQLQ